MSETRDRKTRRPRSHSAKELGEYDLLLLLERLESLVEEMDELGVASRAEAAAKIGELHANLDAEA